jgi:hypothetical protein
MERSVSISVPRWPVRSTDSVRSIQRGVSGTLLKIVKSIASGSDIEQLFIQQSEHGHSNIAYALQFTWGCFLLSMLSRGDDLPVGSKR